MKDDSVYLAHVLECIHRIEANTGEGPEAFFASTTVQDAVLRNLQTMCESTKRLSGEVKGRHPEVEWRKIAAFRNVLVHEYLGVDLETVWEIIEQDLPKLKHAVETLVAEGK